jgi:hypothetical protein
MKLFILNDNKHSFDEVLMLLQTCLAFPKSQLISMLTLIDEHGKCCVLETDSTEVIDGVKEFFIKQGLKVELKES